MNSSSKKLEIVGERIILRKLKFSDSRDIYSNLKDRKVVKWLLSIPHPYTIKCAEKFIRKTHYDFRKRKAYVFGLTLKKEKKVIGVISVCNLDYKNRNAEVGYWLGKRYWNQELMTEASSLILKFGFKQLRLHKIHAGVFEKNIASKRVLEKAGFKQEGTIRQSRLKHGEWQNELRYGILCSE